MGTIASALTRSRNTVVQLRSEPGAPRAAAPSKRGFFRSRGKGASKAAAGRAWEGSGRRGRRRREKEEDERHEELSVVLKRPGEEQGTAGLALPIPRRSRSAYSGLSWELRIWASQRFAHRSSTTCLVWLSQ
ncbi:UNVERIFIED_CONTAM: hypothetical protein K2H54_048733 [Gekko kuhli]